MKWIYKLINKLIPNGSYVKYIDKGQFGEYIYEGFLYYHREFKSCFIITENNSITSIPIFKLFKNIYLKR